jgi:Uma2 family endonuclease
MHIGSAKRITKRSIPPLENGDRLTQVEFHRRYEASPENIKAELIGGIVYMASPLRRPHGYYQPELSGVFLYYKADTPGVEVLDNATTILGDDSEPQPDLALRILPEYGGQSRTNKADYVVSAPELIAEIAHSSRSIDLHAKKNDYERAGVKEYIVLSVEDAELYWFDFAAKRPIRVNREGILRSRVFPGLWIHRKALLERNTRKLIRVIQQGLASPEHTRFVERLETERASRPRS